MNKSVIGIGLFLFICCGCIVQGNERGQAVAYAGFCDKMKQPGISPEDKLDLARKSEFWEIKDKWADIENDMPYPVIESSDKKYLMMHRHVATGAATWYLYIFKRQEDGTYEHIAEYLVRSRFGELGTPNDLSAIKEHVIFLPDGLKVVLTDGDGKHEHQFEYSIPYDCWNYEGKPFEKPQVPVVK